MKLFKLFFTLGILGFISLNAQDPNFPDKGKTPYHNPENALKTIQLKGDYYLELVVCEPIIREPVLSVFDGNGNMYVAEMRTYMQDINGTGGLEKRSRVSRHEDTDGDGKYDRHTVFADNLLLPRIVLPLDHRIIIGETNTLDLYCYEDTDGDGVADKKTLWYEGGKRGGNMEHQPSGLIWSMDNWLYTTYNSYRLRYKNGKVIKEKISGNDGQWGLTQDNEGMPWFVNAGGERGPVNFQWSTAYGKSQVEDQFKGKFKAVWPIANVPDVQGGLRRVTNNNLNHISAACGQAIFRGDRLPKDIQGDLLFSEPVGRLIRRAKISKKEGIKFLSNPYEAEKSEFILSTDPNFRVVNMNTAPDGSLYIVDMYRGIIQEGAWVGKGSYLRKVIEQYRLQENFGKGRVWRLRHKGFELGKQPRMLEESPAQLVKHLSHPNGWWRDTAQKLLILKGDKSVKSALENLALSGPSPESKMHALWTLEGLDLITEEFLNKTFKDKNKFIRKTSIRVSETLFKEGNKNIEPFILNAFNDPEIEVQMQAMLTARFLNLSDWKSKVEATVAGSSKRGFEEIKFRLLNKESGHHHGRHFKDLHAVELINQGKEIYSQLCASCHGKDAKGQLTGNVLMAPPLLGSKRVLGPKEQAINIVMHGLSGEIDGKNYPGGLMIPMGSNGDKWIAAVLTYIRMHFGNKAGVVTESDVIKVRKQTSERKTPWTIEELNKKSIVNLDRKTWKVTASHGEKWIKNALDDNWKSNYSTGKFQEPGMWLQVELPEVRELTRLIMDSGSTPWNFPYGFKVETSTDGKSWKNIANQKSLFAITEVEFAPVKAKFLKITLTQKRWGNSWNICDLTIHALPK